MDLNYILAADYANVDRDGKLNVMGIFNEISAREFPVVHPEMRVIVSLAATPAEAGVERHFAVKLLDEDGQEMLEWARDIKVPPYQGKPIIMNQILRFVGVGFPKAGEYAFNCLVDNDYKGRAPIYVVQVVDADSD